MHGLVFERGIQPFEGQVRTPLERVDDRVVAAAGEVEHGFARRPHRRRAAPRDGSVDAVGIDAAREQRFEAFVNWRAAESAPKERDHAERRQVALVEHDGIAKRDWTGIVSGRIDQVEDGPRSRAVTSIPLDRGRPLDRGDGNGRLCTHGPPHTPGSGRLLKTAFGIRPTPQTACGCPTCDDVWTRRASSRCPRAALFGLRATRAAAPSGRRRPLPGASPPSRAASAPCP